MLSSQLQAVKITVIRCGRQHRTVLALKVPSTQLVLKLHLCWLLTMMTASATNGKRRGAAIYAAAALLLQLPVRGAK